MSKKRAAIDKSNVVLQQLEVEYVPVDDIKPNDYNPNRQSEHDFELLCKSIAEDGFTQPIIVQRQTKEIVDGEHRWRACKALGFQEVPVVFTDMTAEQARISTLRHNRARGSEDVNLAADVLRQLAQMNATDYAKESLGLDDLDVKRMLEITAAEAGEVEVEVPPEMLGPRGKGLTDGDQNGSIDTTADHLRAKEKMVREAKKGEEARMTEQDNRVCQLICHFTGSEAEIVRKVLHPDNAANLLKICHEEIEAGRAA